MTGAEITRPPVYRITLVQCAVLACVAVLLSLQNMVLAYSVVLGGLIAVIPQAWFGLLVFRHRGARSAQRVAQSSYLGEVGKFALSVAGFALVFALVRPLSAGTVFIGFIGMLGIHIAGSWLLVRQLPSQHR